MSGNSGRNSSVSKGFDFATTDDILCSYEDYGNTNLDSSNGNLSDPGVGSNSNKEFHKTRMARTPMFPTSTYISPEDSSNNEVISSVDRTMKKYTENIMRFLEGISSRLSQLELYCYNLDKSIVEMRSDLVRDHEEADTKLKSLEKHLQEVHRSVQILRDKQELADTQKELAKLQLSQKEPSSSAATQKNEEKTTPKASDTKSTENTPDVREQQLALALPQQVAHQPQQPTPPQGVAPQQPYYLQPSQIPTLPPQNQYLASASPYQTQQAPPQPAQPQGGNQPPQYQQQWLQQAPPQPAQPAQPQANQPPQYQQQWTQQAPQQATPQPSPMQPQIRPSASTTYPPYLPNQPANASLPETLPNSMPMQVPYSGVPQPSGSRAEAALYGYGGPVRPIQPPPQQLKSQYGGQNDGYASSGPHSSLSSANSYMMYQNEGGRAHHPHQPHYAEGSYPPPSVPSQGPPSNAGASMSRPPQFSRGHPYNELIDKLVGMGYRGEHVAGVIQRLEENGKSVDFNAVLDILNGHPSGGSQRGWSG